MNPGIYECVSCDGTGEYCRVFVSAEGVRYHLGLLSYSSLCCEPLSDAFDGCIFMPVAGFVL